MKTILRNLLSVLRRFKMAMLLNVLGLSIAFATRSTNDVQQVQMLFTMLFRIVLYAPILGLGGVYKVFQTDASMTWILALAVIVIMLFVALLFRIAMPKFTKLQFLIDELNLVSREILTGVPVIRAFSREKHEEQRFEEANAKLTRTNLFVNRCMTFMMPVMMLLMNGVTVLIVWNGDRKSTRLNSSHLA